jgi:hypothetical protein
MSVRTKAGSLDTVNLNPAQVQLVRQAGVIESVLAMDYHAMTMTGHDLPENVNAIGLISTGFDDLGLPPLLGRGLMRSDAIDGQDPEPVTVVSYQSWQEHLGADPGSCWPSSPRSRRRSPRGGVESGSDDGASGGVGRLQGRRVSHWFRVCRNSATIWPQRQSAIA